MAGSGPPSNRLANQPAWEPADIVAWLLVAVLGVLGVFLVARAQDLEIGIFGISLAGFAAVFLFFEVKRFLNRGDTARLQAKGSSK